MFYLNHLYNTLKLLSTNKCIIKGVDWYWSSAHVPTYVPTHVPTYAMVRSLWCRFAKTERIQKYSFTSRSRRQSTYEQPEFRSSGSGRDPATLARYELERPISPIQFSSSTSLYRHPSIRRPLCLPLCRSKIEIPSVRCQLHDESTFRKPLTVLERT